MSDPNCVCGGCTRARTAAKIAQLTAALAGETKALELVGDRGLVEYNELRAENARLRAKCRRVGLRLAELHLINMTSFDGVDGAPTYERNNARLERVVRALLESR